MRQGLRRNGRLDFLIVAAIGLIVAVAAADSLRSGHAPTRPGAAPDSDVREVSRVAPRPTLTQQVRDVGDEWAARFARGKAHDCLYMTQRLCETLACEGPGPREMENCARPTRAYRRTFERALVRDVAVKYDRAAARLSNSAVIELSRTGDWWLVDGLGGKAGRGFFNSRGTLGRSRSSAATDSRERRRTPRPHFSAR